MPLIIREQNQSNFEPIPEDLHHAICYAIYDLGTQYSKEYDKYNKQLIIAWELPDVRMIIQKDDEEINVPRIVSKRYNQSLNEKSKLRKDLESWRGKIFTVEEREGFDVTKLLGINCMIQIIHNKKDDRTYANISNIIPLHKSIEKKSPENKVKYYYIEQGFDFPEGTPDWIIGLIKESEEFKSKRQDEEGLTNLPSADEESVPF